MAPVRLLLGLAAALALAACDRLPTTPDPVFEARVRAYLLEHPEVIEEAVQRLNARREAEAGRAVAVALREQRPALERDPRDFVANPNGRLTVTQFYDYRCSFCIAAAPEVLALIRQRPDVRVVFKELPLLGPTSDRAARLALIVRRRGGDSLALYRDLTAARPLDDAAVDRIAAAYGVAPAELSATTAGDADHLEDVRRLAETLRIDGTPTFIVGDRLIPGADMAAVRQALGNPA